MSRSTIESCDFYEINGVLFDEDSPFVLEESTFERNPGLLENMLTCQLLLKPGHAVQDTRGYLMSK